MDPQSTGLVSIDRQPQHATLRSFGLAVALLCLARGGWSWTNGLHTTASVMAFATLVLALLAWLRPSLLRGPYVLLGVLSFPLRWLVSYCVLACLYFAVVTPVALGVRLARRLRARGPGSPSHWRVSPPRAEKASYFRQF